MGRSLTRESLSLCLRLVHLQGDGIDLSFLTAALSPQENVSDRNTRCADGASCAAAIRVRCRVFSLRGVAFGCLAFASQVAEGDQLWEFDQLFADVSSEMLAEMEPDEKEGEEGEEPDDEHAGVAKGDGKKAAAPIRDRSNKAASTTAH